MDHLERKTLKTSRGFTFTYYAPPLSADVGNTHLTLLFLHGFPDNAHLWEQIVPSLSDFPYRVIVPDLLGYSGTSKPEEAHWYNFRDQSNDLTEILDAEGVKNVVVIGHDWGSSLASRFYLFHPEWVVGIVFVSVAYMPPSFEPFDLDAANAMTEKFFGYPSFAYWELFTAKEAPALLKENVERFYEVLHGDAEDWMQKMFCTRGAMREYLIGDQRVPLKPYAQDPAFKQAFIERFRKDGFEGPVNYYKAATENAQSEVDKDIPKERLKVNLPVLFIGCTGDAVCRIDYIERPQKAGLLPDLEVKVIESGHWVPYEKPLEVADALTSFLNKRFPTTGLS